MAKAPKETHDQRINRLLADAEGAGATDVKVHTTCRNCGKAFNDKSTADEMVFGYHQEHPFIPGKWLGPHNN